MPSPGAIRLRTMFTRWKEEVIRLALRTGHVLKADDTKRINGYTFDQLKDIIQAQVNAHEQDHNNPHEDSYPHVDIVSREEWERIKAGRLVGGVFPLSFIPPVSYTLMGRTLTIGALEIRFRGWRVQVPAAVLLLPASIPANDEEHVSVKISMVNGVPVGQWVSTRLAVANDHLIALVITGPNQPFTVTRHDGAFIQYCVISEVGKVWAIPASAGLPTSTTGMNSTWTFW